MHDFAVCGMHLLRVAWPLCLRCACMHLDAPTAKASADGATRLQHKPRHECRYGTAFGEEAGLADSVESICAALTAHGYSYSGKDLLTSGITGAHACDFDMCRCELLWFMTVRTLLAGTRCLRVSLPLSQILSTLVS